jgi:hypothetical protein
VKGLGVGCCGMFDAWSLVFKELLKDEFKLVLYLIVNCINGKYFLVMCRVCVLRVKVKDCILE